MINIALKILLFCIPVILHAQWSTSPYTKDALWACPGFSSRIVTYPDGSSIIVGIGDNSEIWMQKLDPNGYKQWLPWISVFPSISGLRYFLPDDDGGIYAIIGTQAQRVDKNGNLRWGENGKQIIPSGSLTKAITDGKNGFIGIYNYFDSLQRIIVFRYDSSGFKLWEKQIDSSSVQGSISGNITGRLGEKSLIHTNNNKYIQIDLQGLKIGRDSSIFQSNIFVNESDSVGFNVQFLSTTIDSQGYRKYKDRVIKFSNNWDTVWTVVVEFMDTKGFYQYLSVGVPFFPDGIGGLFFFSSHIDSSDIFHTRIQRISKYGFTFSGEGIIIDGIAGRQFFNSGGKIGFITDRMFAQSVNDVGDILWPDSFSVIQDYNNTYFVNATSDNLGGAILSFWTVAGGIKVQHTGRVGKVGVLTNIIDNKKSVAESFELSQNYPNPFNPVTTINYALPQDGMVTLKIYDALGRETSILVKEYKQSGRHIASFDATGLSSGVYFYKLVSGKFTAIRKMILIK